MQATVVGNGVYGATDPVALGVTAASGRFSVAELASGGFVLTANKSTGAGRVLFAIFDRDGHMRTPFKLVSTGYHSDVVGLVDGRFVVTWNEQGILPGIRAQLFDASGSAVGASVAVSQSGDIREQQVSVAALASGGFVGAWTDLENGLSLVKMRYFAANGQPITDEIILSELGPGKQGNFPQIAVTTTGNIIATWNGATGNSFDTVVYALYNAQGGLLKPLAAVNGVGTDDPFYQSVAALPGGRFVATWTNDDRSGRTSVHGQVFDSAGKAIGAEIVIDPAISVAAGQSTVAALDDGRFLVTWRSETRDGGPNYFQNGDVFGRIYDTNGIAVGDAFTINTSTAQGQDLPAATAFGSGDFAVIYGDYFGVGLDYRLVERVFLSTTNGGPGGDVLAGTKDRDFILAGGGDDRIEGSDGRDTIDGGAGTDFLVFSLSKPAQFAQAVNSRNFQVSNNRIIDSAGFVDTTFTSIEDISFSYEPPFGSSIPLLTIDASFSNISAGLNLVNGEQAILRGGSGNDGARVQGGTLYFDGGAGDDRYVGSVFDSATTVSTVGGSILIVSRAGYVSNVTLENVENLTLYGNVDASSTYVPNITFIDGVGQNIVFGSRANNLFVATSQFVDHVGVLFDELTGNGGIDQFDVTDNLNHINKKFIVDFDSDDRLIFSDGSGIGDSSIFIGNMQFTGRPLEYRYYIDEGRTYIEFDVTGDGRSDGFAILDSGGFDLIETSPGSNILKRATPQTIFIGIDSTDVLIGSDGHDNVRAYDGDDRIDAGSGNDYVDGGRGADRIDGGAGNDVLRGGEGVDTFVFAKAYSGADRIADFSIAEDWFDLGGSRFTSLQQESSSVLLTFSGGVVRVDRSFGVSLAQWNARVVDSGAVDAVAGTLSNDILTGDFRVQLFDLSQGGDDHLSAGEGDDGVFFGAAFTSADFVDGGAGGNDQVGLQGNYSAGITLGATQLTNVEVVALLPGFSYAITTLDSLVAAGQQMRFHAGQLLAGQNFSFDGRAETDGSFRIYGGRGADVIRTGAGDDVILFGPAQFNATLDIVDNGGGSDRLVLDGSYTATLTVANAGNVERVELARGVVGDLNSFAITLADGFAPSGTVRTVSAAATVVAARIDGSAEADASLRLEGGAAADVLIGGGGADVLTGGLGGDRLTGGGGGDIFLYTAAAQSSSVRYDTLVDFDVAVDRIDVPGTITSLTTILAVSLSTATFDADIARAVGSSLAAGAAVNFQVIGGDLAGRHFLVIDGDGVAGYTPDADFVIELGAAVPSGSPGFIV